MSLPPPAPREKLHRREIAIEGFVREDGNYDIDAWLSDIKSHEFNTDRGAFAAGSVLHGMGARMTVTPMREIVDFVVSMEDTPSAACDTAPANFKALIGLTIGPGFVREAYARVGGTLGCTHIREMLQQMATVVYQTQFKLRRQTRDPQKPPPLLNSCHGWRADGDLVRNNYPAFYQAAARKGGED
jgi:hypothetical protein